MQFIKNLLGIHAKFPHNMSVEFDLRPLLRIAPLLPLLLLISCGSEVGCALYGDNVEGHVTFTSTAPATLGAIVVIETSEDDFASIKRTVKVVNQQGFLTVGYSICADVDIVFKVRAYRDVDNDNAWESGEGAGRNDGTSDGHSTYTSHTISNSDGQWSVESGVNVYLDATTSQ